MPFFSHRFVLSEVDEVEVIVGLVVNFIFLRTTVTQLPSSLNLNN